MSQVDFNFQRLYQTPCCSCHHIEQLNIFKSHFLSFDVKTKLQMFTTLKDLLLFNRNKPFWGEHKVILPKKQFLGIFFYVFKMAMAIAFLCKNAVEAISAQNHRN